MKQHTKNQAISHTSSIFSTLALATVMVISLGSCSKTADVIPPSQPSTQVVSTEATPTVNGVYVHNVFVYVPSSKVLSVAVKSNDAPVSWTNTYGKVGWVNMNLRVKANTNIMVTLFKGTISEYGGSTYATKNLTAPGNDGLTNWWIKL